MRNLNFAFLAMVLLGLSSEKVWAADAELTGSAVIRCKVNLDGTLTNCQVLSEEPKDGQFGQNALMMAKMFKLKPDGVEKAKRDGGYYTTRVVFKNNDQPNGGPPEADVAGKAVKDEDWQLLTRLKDRWVFIQGQRSRTKDLSKWIFVLTAYTTPHENLGHPVAFSLDGNLFDCGHRIVKLGSRINFGENGQPVDAGQYGGILEPVDEDAVGRLKIKTVCDSMKLTGPNAPTQGLAVGLVKGMTAQLPAEQLEKMVPTQSFSAFDPPPLELMATQQGTTQLPVGKTINLVPQPPQPPRP